MPNLDSMGKLSGESDVFVEVTVHENVDTGTHIQTSKTKYIDDDLNPVWTKKNVFDVYLLYLLYFLVWIKKCK